MKFKIVAIILLLSLFLFFVSEKISANENKKQSTNIAQINIWIQIFLIKSTYEQRYPVQNQLKQNPIIQLNS